MKSISLICLFLVVFSSLFENSMEQSTEPIIDGWLKTTGTGYSSIVNNIDSVKYSASYVYVHGACIPAYSVGPWASNPNVPKNQNFTFKYPRTPAKNTGTKFAAPLGQIGAWINGVTVFNAKDAMSYNNLGVWNRNAYVWEKSSFDSCNGHPDQTGQYHHHVNPTCLYSTSATTKHSPLIGFAFDGFPIYGPFAYSNPNDTTSQITRMTSSYKTFSYSKRDTLANGTKLSTSYQGPDVSTDPTSTYRIGGYIEDYYYSKGNGTLDEFNGRYGKTPDYPNGVYAYFVSTDTSGNPTYPYVIGPYYYGVVVMSNIGPNSGKSYPTETVTIKF